MLRFVACASSKSLSGPSHHFVALEISIYQKMKNKNNSPQEHLFGYRLAIVEIIVALEFPQVQAVVRRVLPRHEISEKQVYGILLLGIGERVAVVTLDRREQVSRLRRPVVGV